MTSRRQLRKVEAQERPPLSVRDGHQLVHRLLDAGQPEPTATTVRLHLGEVSVHLEVDDPAGWWHWVGLLAPGYKTHIRPPAGDTARAARVAVGRLSGVRASVTVMLAAHGAPASSMSPASPTPPGERGPAG